MEQITGYLRADGKIGVRNHVLVIPSSGCALHVAKMITRKVPGAVCLANQYGCGQIGKDLEQTFRTLAGLGRNPNVGAVMVVGLGCESLQPGLLADNIALSGKPVEMIIIQNNGGTSGAIAKGTQLLKKLAANVAKAEPSHYPASEIILGLECGASDATSGLAANPSLGYAADMLVQSGGSIILSETVEIIGAEHVLARRAANPEIAAKLLGVVQAFEQRVVNEGSDIRDTQPTPGNKAGGITTLEEKSLGCIYKAGTTAVNDVLAYAEGIRGKGLSVMDTPGHDIQSMIGMLAGGAQIVAFTTGRGSPCGTPIAPVVKITANKQTYAKMMDNIDVYVGGVIEGSSSIQVSGAQIYEQVMAACNGQLTCSEKLQHREFALWRIGTSY
ncbi:altronate dehydratase large subunit [Desulfotomaculum arcticum]|uniref:Altronate dehydratase large subunit n=1 Tax=Desulfotruncus arcticus DSM 17038 TaxID=1121424 RepID=A0A1I2WNG2_9FIRM|nr:UxaA family hydrolase [Desulfotruncus arcticus]SFH02908.1 altronate dehydratase large subunit [Desulfotomaculum arcticum] [Desulfotruncus arcticus DSM 17038]